MNLVDVTNCRMEVVNTMQGLAHTSPEVLEEEVASLRYNWMMRQ